MIISIVTIVLIQITQSTFGQQAVSTAKALTQASSGDGSYPSFTDDSYYYEPNTLGVLEYTNLILDDTRDMKNKVADLKSTIPLQKDRFLFGEHWMKLHGTNVNQEDLLEHFTTEHQEPLEIPYLLPQVPGKPTVKIPFVTPDLDMQFIMSPLGVSEDTIWPSTPTSLSQGQMTESQGIGNSAHLEQEGSPGFGAGDGSLSELPGVFGAVPAGFAKAEMDERNEPGAGAGAGADEPRVNPTKKILESLNLGFPLPASLYGSSDEEIANARHGNRRLGARKGAAGRSSSRGKPKVNIRSNTGSITYADDPSTSSKDSTIGTRQFTLDPSHFVNPGTFPGSSSSSYPTSFHPLSDLMAGTSAPVEVSGMKSTPGSTTQSGSDTPQNHDIVPGTPDTGMIHDAESEKSDFGVKYGRTFDGDPEHGPGDGASNEVVANDEIKLEPMTHNDSPQEKNNFYTKGESKTTQGIGTWHTFDEHLRRMEKANANCKPGERMIKPCAICFCQSDSTMSCRRRKICAPKSTQGEHPENSKTQQLFL